MAKFCGVGFRSQRMNLANMNTCANCVATESNTVSGTRTPFENTTTLTVQVRIDFDEFARPGTLQSCQVLLHGVLRDCNCSSSAVVMHRLNPLPTHEGKGRWNGLANLLLSRGQIVDDHGTANRLRCLVVQVDFQASYRCASSVSHHSRSR